MSEQNGHHGEHAVEEILSIPIPPGWSRVTVANVGDVRLGRQRSPKNRSLKYPTKYLRAANLTWDGIDLSDVLDMEFRPAEREVYRLQPGDVLLSEASGSATEVGKPAIWNGELDECCFQNTVIRFRPNAVDSRFALVVFQHFARNGIFARVSKGVGIHHLSADRFAAMPFLLPPRDEQRRIVAKIEELFSKLDAGVTALKRAKANLKRYRAAVLKAAVTGQLTAAWRAANLPSRSGRGAGGEGAPQVEGYEPATKLLTRILAARRQKWEQDQLAKFAAAKKPPPKNWQAKYTEPTPPDTTNLPTLPTGWCWASVEQLCDVGTGTTPSRKNPTFYEGGTIPWVMSTAVNRQFVEEGTELVTEVALRETSLEVYPVGTLIIALYGEGKTRGMVSELRINAAINQALGALVFDDVSNSVRPYV